MARGLAIGLEFPLWGRHGSQRRKYLLGMRIEMRFADFRRRQRPRQQDCPKHEKPRLKGRVLRQGYASASRMDLPSVPTDASDAARR